MAINYFLFQCWLNSCWNTNMYIWYKGIRFWQSLYWFLVGLRIQFVCFHAFSISKHASANCPSVITSGGENLMMFCWVGFATTPWYNIFFEKLYANSSEWNYTPMNKPFPRIYLTRPPWRIWLKFFLKIYPSLAEF